LATFLPACPPVSAFVSGAPYASLLRAGVVSYKSSLLLARWYVLLLRRGFAYYLDMACMSERAADCVTTGRA